MGSSEDVSSLSKEEYEKLYEEKFPELVKEWGYKRKHAFTNAEIELSPSRMQRLKKSSKVMKILKKVGGMAFGDWMILFNKIRWKKCPFCKLKDNETIHYQKELENEGNLVVIKNGHPPEEGYAVLVLFEGEEYHNTPFHELETKELHSVLETINKVLYCEIDDSHLQEEKRLKNYRNLKKFAFLNFGPAAGGSKEHPHIQVWFRDENTDAKTSTEAYALEELKNLGLVLYEEKGIAVIIPKHGNNAEIWIAGKLNEDGSIPERYAEVLGATVRAWEKTLLKEVDKAPRIRLGKKVRISHNEYFYIDRNRRVIVTRVEIPPRRGGFENGFAINVHLPYLHTLRIAYSLAENLAKELNVEFNSEKIYSLLEVKTTSAP